MPNLPWREAILRVLSTADEPMHYTEIAQAIIDQKLRQDVGATPSNAVASALSSQALVRKVVRVERGYYILASKLQLPQAGSTASSAKGGPRNRTASVSTRTETVAELPDGESGLIGSFGMFWLRSEVDWTATPVKLLGVQLDGGNPVDFAEQAGVYLLYEGNRVIYVGRVTSPRLGQRLWEHTRDRLKARWDKFSWFGVRSVGDNGCLGSLPHPGFTLAALIATMEALLIEGLEPPQNRRQGDGFKALEFIQEVDPQIEIVRERQILVKYQDEFR